MLARNVSGGPPEDDDDLLISTLKCTACGKTWVLTEDVEDRPEDERPSKRDASGHYVCSNCGAKSIWQAGLTKIQRRQG